MSDANILARGAREVVMILSGATPTHRELRDRLVMVVALTAMVDVVCSLLAYLFERHATGTQIHALGDAAFFATTQLLTVSSSVTNPLTTGGRVLDVFMELYAITIVASLAGMTGSFFHRRSSERRAG